MKISIFFKIPYKAFSLEDLTILEPLKKYASQLEVCEDEVQFLTSLKTADIALVWYFKSFMYDSAPNLKLVFTPAAGKDWVAEDKTGRVKVFFGTFHGDMIQESFLGMLFYFHAHLNIALLWQKKHIWSRAEFPVRDFLSEKTLLIVGYGNIAKSCAKGAISLGMKVYGVKRSVIHEGAIVDGVSVFSMEHFTRLITLSDHILLLLPKSEETDHLFNLNTFKLCKKNSVIYNFGRGNSICLDSLMTALDDELISAAGLDVLEDEPLDADHPLWDYSNVLITPHSSCFFSKYMELFIKEVVGYIKQNQGGL